MQNNRPIHSFGQAYLNFLNFISFCSNYKQICFIIYLDVDLYIQNVELFMPSTQTHFSEKGVVFCEISQIFLLYMRRKEIFSIILCIF